MNLTWMFLSFRGRLGPKRFERAFYVLTAVAIVALIVPRAYQGHPPKRTLELLILAATVLASWPWLALTIKRPHDAERSILFAIPAAVAWPLFGVVHAASDSGIITSPVFTITSWLAFGVFWTCEMRISEFDSANGPNRFGPPAEQATAAAA